MKILILGVSNVQADAISYLKEKGHYVIGISYKQEGAALNLIDEFALINIVDKVAVLEYAKKQNVDLVYSVGSDLAMPTVGYVNEKLHLPSFLTEKIALLMQNKSSFRAFLEENNISSIKYKKASKIEDLESWTDFPAIIKPVDSQGQRGVVEVSSFEDMKEKFSFSLEASRSSSVIVEQYIPGDEISVNGYFYNGDLKYCFISDRRVIEGFSGGLVKGHDFPSKLPQNLKSKVKQLVCDVASEIGYQNGPIYFQMKYTDDVYIIEGTPRFDGCHIWRLINQRYDINLLDIVFNHLMGNKIDFPIPVEPQNRKDILDFFVQKPFTKFQEATFLKEKNDSAYFELYYKEGEEIRPINGKMDKVGYKTSILFTE